MKNAKLRGELFKEIKNWYSTIVIPYDLSLKGLPKYMIAYLKIETLLGALGTDRLEIRLRCGEEFEKWFYETHEIIVKQFWEDKAF